MPEVVFPTLGLHLVLLSCIAYLTTAVMERLRTEERHGLAVRQRSELIMQTTGVGFAIWDREGVPDWLNPQMQEWLELDPHSIVSTWPDLSYWTGGKSGDIEKTYLDGRVRTAERSRVDSKGEGQIYYVVTMPVIDGHGQIYEVVELVQRITERKRQSSELARSAQLAAVGVMAAGIAHEVNNPLASISTRLRLLEEEHTPEFQTESLKLIQGQVLRIAQIVRSVTQFARVPEQVRSEFDLNTLISETINLLQFHDKRALCRITTQLDPGLPPVNANRSQLQQVFLNLGLNAFEAMNGGGQLTVSTFARDGEVCTVFKDTGCGVPEPDRASIFNAFYSTKSRGLGLGLTVANDIVKSHGGRIEVTGSAGGGAVFTVSLPAAPDKIHPEDVLQ
jgi:signal transduction histidine kinase